MSRPREFKIDLDINITGSHKMGEARIYFHEAVKAFGPGTGESGDGKCKSEWAGYLTFKDEDGEDDQVKAVFWDWKGSSEDGYVSVWIEDPVYMSDFIDAIERAAKK